METNLKIDITVADICDGFVYNQFEGKGLFGLNGKLTIQPEYQRNYIYADGGGKKEQAVIKTKAHSGTTSACAPVFGELTKTHCAHSAWSHCRQFIALLGSSSHLAKIWLNETSFVPTRYDYTRLRP